MLSQIILVFQPKTKSFASIIFFLFNNWIFQSESAKAKSVFLNRKVEMLLLRERAGWIWINSWKVAAAANLEEEQWHITDLPKCAWIHQAPTPCWKMKSNSAFHDPYQPLNRIGRKSVFWTNQGASLPIMGLLVHIAMRTPITLDFLCAWIRPCTQKICAWS